LALQTTKKFQKGQFCRNMPIIPLPRVIFQLNEIIKNYFFFKKKKGKIGVWWQPPPKARAGLKTPCQAHIHWRGFLHFPPEPSLALVPQLQFDQ
jgi:hypothetical protein